MSSKTPIRAVFNDSNVATGLAEFQSGEFIPLSHGGIGASLSIGSAGRYNAIRRICSPSISNNNGRSSVNLKVSKMSGLTSCSF